MVRAVGRPAPDLRGVCNGYANGWQPDGPVHKERALSAMRMQSAAASRLHRRRPGTSRAIGRENSSNHGVVEALCLFLSVHQACGAESAAIDGRGSGRDCASDRGASAYRSSGR
ncbi:conserved protein of unknown function [Bradyrhizobium sp. ORS 285]|nr:conserved protein of unknown function [Bradyrhizobium sp. ORS 285]